MMTDREDKITLNVKEFWEFNVDSKLTITRCERLACGLPSDDEISEASSGAIHLSVNSLADLAKLG